MCQYLLDIFGLSANHLAISYGQFMSAGTVRQSRTEISVSFLERNNIHRELSVSDWNERKESKTNSYLNGIGGEDGIIKQIYFELFRNHENNLKRSPPKT